MHLVPMMTSPALPARVMTHVASRMREVMREVVLPLWCNLDAGDAWDKGHDNPVTVADVRAEALLTPFLLDLLPGSRVIGEEAVSQNASVADTPGLGRVWTLDPVDGTRAFRDGVPGFGMLVGLMRDGVPEAGWLLRGVEDDMLMTDGVTTCRSLGGKTRSPVMRVLGTREVPFGAAGASRTCRAFGPAVMKELKAKGVFSRRFAYSVGEYHDFSVGKMDFLLSIHDDPWDHVPGLAVARAMGADIRSLDGRAWNADNLMGVLASADDTITDTLVSASMRSLERVGRLPVITTPVA